MFSIGSFAIIFDDHRRLLLCHRRDLDVWNLPGGGVEIGELPTEAIIREVKEETGLDAVVDQLVGVYGKSDRKDDLVFSFLCHVTGGQQSITDEADEIKYFKMDDIPVNTSPKQVERILDALNFNGKPVFKRQTGPSTKEMLQQLKR